MAAGVQRPIERAVLRHVTQHRRIMPASRTHRQQRPIQYRDRQDRVWSVSEVAVLKVVSPAIDGPNLAPVIRFEHEGQERFARWIGEPDWREQANLQRLFETTDPPSGMGMVPPGR